MVELNVLRLYFSAEHPVEEALQQANLHLFRDSLPFPAQIEMQIGAGKLYICIVVLDLCGVGNMRSVRKFLIWIKLGESFLDEVLVHGYKLEKDSLRTLRNHTKIC